MTATALRQERPYGGGLLTDRISIFIRTEIAGPYTGGDRGNTRDLLKSQNSQPRSQESHEDTVRYVAIVLLRALRGR